MYKILVIDDDWLVRRLSYRALLRSQDGFELVFLEDGLKDLSAINDISIDCIALDLSLDYKNTNANENLRLVLKKIQNKKPVILISSKFTQHAEWVKLPDEYNVKVIDYFGWSEKFTPSGKFIDNNLVESTIIRIKNSLDDFYNRTRSRKKLNETIKILLLSDLQFGDPNFSDDTLLSELNLSRYLLNNKIIPDLIMISGDISYSASPDQFKLAESWILKLCEQIYQDAEDFSERIIIVPGNHDVNLALSSADYYKYNFEEYKDEKYLSKRESPPNEYKTFGLYPFCDFAYKLTSNS